MDDRCDCIIRAIESAAVWRKARTEGSRVLVSYIAQKLHSGDFDIKSYLAAKKRESDLRASLPLHAELEALDPARTAVHEVEIPATEESQETHEALSEAPVASEDHPAVESAVPDAWRWTSQRRRSPLDGIFGSDF
jgi:hypothetical protein